MKKQRGLKWEVQKLESVGPMIVTEQQAYEAEELAEQIAPLLAGHVPMVQGTVLADLLATWLAGHFDHRGKKETAKLRRLLLALHVALVKRLIRTNEAIILERTREQAN